MTAVNEPVQLPPVGTRISHSGHRGTIRFVGEVDGTEGVWLGVEWDDPQRGKHNGVKDGKRYFSCREVFALPHSHQSCYNLLRLDSEIQGRSSAPRRLSTTGLHFSGH